MLLKGGEEVAGKEERRREESDVDEWEEADGSACGSLFLLLWKCIFVIGKLL